VESFLSKLAAKTITQAQYDTEKADITNIAANAVNDKHDRQSSRGGHGPGNDNDADDVTPTTTPTTATAPTARPSINNNKILTKRSSNEISQLLFIVT
jgi:hypothetical protein